MHRLRFIFGLLVAEIALVTVIGLMALDNNSCDIINGWHWSYETSPPTTSISCSTINISVASSEGRFDSLLVVLITIPATAIWGYLTARNYERRDNQRKYRSHPSDSGD